MIERNAMRMATLIDERLTGWTIVGPALTPESDTAGLVIQKGARKRVLWILADAEGNGPGWLELQEGAK